MPLNAEDLMDRMNRRQAPTNILFNTQIIALRPEEGVVRASFDIDARFLNPAGQVQGGIVCAMLDDITAIACIAKSGKRIFVPTLEMKTSYFAPAKPGRLYGEARCLKLGRSFAFVEADLTDEDGTLLARMSLTAAPRELKSEPVLIDRESGDA